MKIFLKISIGITLIIALLLFFFESYVTPYFFFNTPLKQNFFSYISKESSAPRVAVYVSNGVLGEEETAAKLLKAAENLHWEAYVYKIPKPRKNRLKEALVSFSSHLIEKLLNPTFALSLEYTTKRHISNPRFVFLTVAVPFFDKEGNIVEESKNILTYEGIVDGDRTHKKTKDFLEKSHKNIPYIWGAPTSYVPNFSPDPHVLKNATVFYCGANWDAQRKSSPYQEVLKILEKKGVLEVYGIPERWTFLSSSFKGQLPFDGASVLLAIQKTGVVLCLHSAAHIASGIPTARIFEAIAAGALPISDEHPFIQDVFGDTVLYIDTSLPPEKMAQQILNHLEWVHTHPEEAAEKIKRAQKIFSEKYSSEILLQNIYKELYKKVSS